MTELNKLTVGCLTTRDSKSIFPDSLENIFARMTNSDYAWKTKIEELRSAAPDDQVVLKQALPAIMFAHECTEKGQRPKKESVNFNGLLVYDVDHLDNPAAERDRIAAHPSCVFAAISCRGKGVFAVIRCTKDASSKRVFELLDTEFKLECDKSCKDLSRLRYISYDPDAKLNWDAKILELSPEIPEGETKVLAQKDNQNFVIAGKNGPLQRTRAAFRNEFQMSDIEIRDLTQQLHDSRDVFVGRVNDYGFPVGWFKREGDGWFYNDRGLYQSAQIDEINPFENPKALELISRIYAVCGNATDDDKRAADLFYWLARKITLNKKIGVSMLWTQAESGLGKSFLGDIARVLMGKAATAFPTLDSLDTSFTYYKTQGLVIVEEGQHSDGPKMAGEKLKAIVTETEKFVNRKGEHPYDAPSTTDYFICGNSQGLSFDPALERRFVFITANRGKRYEGSYDKGPLAELRRDIEANKELVIASLKYIATRDYNFQTIGQNPNLGFGKAEWMIRLAVKKSQIHFGLKEEENEIEAFDLANEDDKPHNQTAIINAARELVRLKAAKRTKRKELNVYIIDLKKCNDLLRGGEEMEDPLPFNPDSLQVFNTQRKDENFVFDVAGDWTAFSSVTKIVPKTTEVNDRESKKSGRPFRPFTPKGHTQNINYSYHGDPDDYDAWIRACGIAALTGDVKGAHDFSSNSTKYIPEETQKKIEEFQRKDAQ